MTTEDTDANLHPAVCSKVIFVCLQPHWAIPYFLSLVKVKLCRRLDCHRLFRVLLGEKNSVTEIHASDVPHSSLASPDSETQANSLVLITHSVVEDLRRFDEMKISKRLSRRIVITIHARVRTTP